MPRPGKGAALSAMRHRLHILNYNIQAGMASRRYADYLLHSWKYFLPHQNRWRNFDAMAHRLKHYDIVALQETDPGSLRTGFDNFTEYLARRAGFPYWFEQINREVGTLSRHGNAILCRDRPFDVVDHKLPGIRGRGALIAQFGRPSTGLSVISVHLALGRRPRLTQIKSLCEFVKEYSHVVLMGDFNCELSSPEMRMLCNSTGLRAPRAAGDTFPSWRPRRRIDHILVSPGISILKADTLSWNYSDHLPVDMQIELPKEVELELS
jgi:endonuclease/exonuclease/phosphatase family metal-dependent hydrolase